MSTEESLLSNIIILRNIFPLMQIYVTKCPLKRNGKSDFNREVTPMHMPVIYGQMKIW